MGGACSSHGGSVVTPAVRKVEVSAPEKRVQVVAAPNPVAEAETSFETRTSSCNSSSDDESMKKARSFRSRRLSIDDGGLADIASIQKAQSFRGRGLTIDQSSLREAGADSGIERESR